MTSCLLLVSGHGKLLENEIEESGNYPQLEGIPKALLPGVGGKGKRILDYWWDALKTRQLFNEVYLVTNADKYKNFERWATASDFPVENIVNDGTTNYPNRLRTLRILDLVIRTKKISEDLFVIAGDMLFQETLRVQDANVDFAQVLNYFKLKRNEADLAIYYEMHPLEKTDTRSIVEVCHKTNRILKYLTKPDPRVTTSRKASVLFYGFRKETLATIPTFLRENGVNEDGNASWSTYMNWLINVQALPVCSMKLPSGFQLIGRVGLSDYEQWLSYFEEQERLLAKKGRITKRAYARVGLIGNPSDGYNGKTIALSVKNFWAEVTIFESSKLCILPHPLNDPTEFGSLGDLYGISKKDGYLGGLRLLQATCKQFYQYCSSKGIALARRNFTLKYDTNIPRQVGLAGSSAIVTASLRCLMQFFNLTDYDISKEIQPQFILDVEKEELHIVAGLQDRVVQVYEGLVYMDFSKPLMDSQGYGNYEVMSGVKTLPHMWLAYIGDPSDSGSIHNDVSLRWHNGDPEVIEAMHKFAEITDQAKKAIEERDWEFLATLMNHNFDLRRNIYGDEAIGPKTLRMIEIGRKFGGCAKLPGSGGAVVGIYTSESKVGAMQNEFRDEGFVIVDIMANI